MVIARLKIKENFVEVMDLQAITSGSIGASVALEFDGSWSGKKCTAVWRGSGRCIDDTTASGKIPPEVVTCPGSRLMVGFYGVEGNTATPTTWADLGTVLNGTDPSGDESTDPSLPVWAQFHDLLGDLDAALDAILDIQQTLMEGDAL